MKAKTLKFTLPMLALLAYTFGGIFLSYTPEPILLSPGASPSNTSIFSIPLILLLVTGAIGIVLFTKKRK